jgi:hypothetical protein
MVIEILLRGMKELLMVESCQRDININKTSYETWVTDFKHLFPGDILFCYGQGARPYPELPSVIFDVPDDYLSLPFKTQAIVRYSIANDYDVLHILDSDVYCRPQNLTHGEEIYTGILSSDGGYLWGACYTLNRKGMELVDSSPIRGPHEDVWVGNVMIDNHIPMTMDPRRILLHAACGHNRRNWHEMPRDFSCVGELLEEEIDYLHFYVKNDDFDKIPHSRSRADYNPSPRKFIPRDQRGVNNRRRAQ